MKKIGPVMLVVLDGFGYRKEREYNAIASAHTPWFCRLWDTYAHAILNASGAAVGLPIGYVGNSEVGHCTIGAGAIIAQPMSIVNNAIKQNCLAEHKILQALFVKICQSGGRLHIMGILSDGGVHGHEDHMYAYIRAAQAAGVRSIVIHPFLDGRDTAPMSATTYLERLDRVLKECSNAVIGSIQGRFYAMDRDTNWNRTEKTVALLTQKQPIMYTSWRQALDYYYTQGVTDEFVPPTALCQNASIKAGDGLLCTNVRSERMRQLAHEICRLKPKIGLISFVTAVPYEGASCVEALFYPIKPDYTLKQILNEHQKRIFTIAETEKYAHVTYFFDGGREQQFAHETRVMIPSLKVERYDIAPQMSAATITQTIKNSLLSDPCDFYLVNYANADMVGHSGNFAATVKAIECLDQQLGTLYQEVVQKRNGVLYITADHGNAEQMKDLVTGGPKTAHTSNPVPFIAVCNDTRCAKQKLPLHQLADIAPFILRRMGIAVL